VPRAGRLLTQELAALGLDLDGLLRAEPRMLLDRELLGSLHLELPQRLAPAEARAALLQLGFLHGLRDALRLLRAGFAPLEPVALGPAATRLAIRLDPGPAREWRGSWPEAIEGRAVADLGAARADPCCHVSAGYTSGWLSGLLEAELIACEHECRAAGGAACRFVARDADACDEGVRAALPFAALRALAERELAVEPDPPPDPERFEPGAPVIHVWGPVMILPFAGTDECLRSLELIGREPAARSVRVVVVDLGGAVIDEGFGAASLEQVLDAVAGWGAEAILTGISPLSEPVVADLEKTHLVMRKDLTAAIAAAFQIAEAQRRSA
jgi:anti-anti-sigma regulatory factor